MRSDLTQQLEQLAAAHELFQQTDCGGGQDPQWASWYATQLLDPTQFRLAIPLTADALAEWLEDEFARHIRSGQSWTEYLSDRLLAISE